MTVASRDVTRRTVVGAGLAGAAGLVGRVRAATADENDEAATFIAELTGRRPLLSGCLHLAMPPQFPTGSVVPLALDIDSPMTEADHVSRLDVVAPKNPIAEVVSFHFLPHLSEPRVATRIRLAAPQTVVALAHMSDGTLLMATTFVDVATNGCN